MKANNLREGTAAQVAPPPKSGLAVITDEGGRRLQLREGLTLLEEQRLLVAMGPHSDNPRALQRALLAARVLAIDEAFILVPQSFRSYEAMLQLVGTAGLVAVVAHLAPAPAGDPVAVFDGEPGDYRLFPHEGGVGLWRIDDDDAPTEDPELATAKK
ncbi:MAG TPA: hypothetical protein VND87_12155 [Stellaceae bacterium]|nr:hypothetical protein [Stellaceae bacterium]